MAVHINKNGDVIIALPSDKAYTGLEKLEMRRLAVYEAIMRQNQEFIDNEVTCGLIEFLKDTEPSYEQWKSLLKNPEEN